MPGSSPIADYSLGALAILIVGYVALALVKRRNGKKPDPPDLTRVVENNTQAMEDNTTASKHLCEVVGQLRDFMLTTSAKQGAQLDELVDHARREG